MVFFIWTTEYREPKTLAKEYFIFKGDIYYEEEIF